MDADLSKTVCIVGRQGEDAMKKWCRIFLLSLLLCIAMCAGAQAAEHDMLRVGLKYGNEAMDEARLQNYSPFGGYALGYYDSSCNFVQLAALPASYEKITVTQDKTYHVQLSETFYDYASASARAAQYGGFAAYDNGAFVARVGNYSDYGSAQSALYSLGTGGTVVGGSSTGVTVIVTGTSTILFEFDQSGLYSLGIRPAEAGQKTVTWFRGYRYYGGFEYQRVTGGAINVINVVAMDDYVKGVIPWEMSSDWPLEALKAQAVCARTYAACQTKHRSQGFDICATTHCQVYQGTAASSSYSDSAVDQTAGQCLYYNGQIVQEAVYYSSNGGASEDSVNVWGNEVGYLKGKIDPYEGQIASRISKYNWSTTYTVAELTNLLSSKGYGVGTVKNMYVSAYTDMGNVYSVTFVGTSGTKTITREACRSVLNLRSQRFTITGGAGGSGYSVNESGESVDAGSMRVIDGSGSTASIAGSAYVITSSGTAALGQGTAATGGTGSGSFTITGSGYGHNVGMSQWGAYAMANLGRTYREILQFYYTGVTII